MDSVKVLKTIGLYRYAQKMRNRQLRPQRLAFFSQLIQNSTLCYDVGANIGNRVEIFLKLGAKCVAIEPQPNPFAYLMRQYGRNENFIGINKGLGPSKGVKDLFLCYADGASSMSQDWISKVKANKRFPKEYTWKDSVVVSITTLDALISSYGLPGFCKIDVEGFEYQVIQGLSHALPLLSFEYTPEAVEVSTSVISYLQNLGQYEYNYVEGESTRFAFSTWKDGMEIVEFLNDLSKQYHMGFGDVYGRLVESTTSRNQRH